MNMLHGIRRTGKLIMLGMAIFLSGQTVQAADTQNVSGTARYDYAYKVLQIVNEERESAGKDALTMDQALLDAAMLRAAEIVVDFDHTRPNGTDCFTACDKMYGENIACGMGGGYGTPEGVMEGWMNSPGHRMNIMNGSYQSIGVGCIQTKSGIYWVQCFGYEATAKAGKQENQKVTYRVARDTSSETVLVSVGEDSEKKEEGAAETIGKVTGFKVTPGKKKLTVKWDKQTGADGYQIQISANKSFKQKQTYNIKGSNNKKILTRCKGKKLQSGKKYYVRIRAYVKEDGTSYSGWKTIVKKVK